MRVALVGGPGGAGSTSTAALIALGAAQAGHPATLISADPDVAGWLDHPDVTVVVPDPVAIVGGGRAAIVDQLAGVADDLLDAEVAGFPGVDVVAMLLVIAENADSDRVLVVDAGSRVAELLALPEAIGFLGDRLMPTPLRILRQVGGLLSGRDAAEPTPPVELVGLVLDRLLLAQAMLTDPGRSALHLVIGSGQRRAEAARRLVPLVAVAGVGLGAVYGSAPEVAGWPAKVIAVPRAAKDPTSVELMSWASTLFAKADPLVVMAGPAWRDEPPVSCDPTTFSWDVPVPLADRSALDLARSGDDLIVTVHGRPRRVELPSVLRRCSITGAALADGRLRITFAADVDRWPQRLADAVGLQGAS